LIRGMLAGLVAGIIAFAFAYIAGEPLVDTAIAFEEMAAVAEATPAPHDHAGMAAHSHGAGEEELVSRGVQGTIGLATGVIVYGAAMGGLFALAFAFFYGRVGPFGPRATAALLAAAAFAVLFLVPALKYPPNPPAVGQPDTIGYRSELFFYMILCSLAAFALVLSLGRRLVARHGAWNGTLLAGAGFIVIVGAVQLLLPVIDEVPADFPASVLWRFRIASLGIQVILWAIIGLLFGVLAERRLAGRRSLAA
jgi:predicted cobalt transporter CbtA